MSSHAAEAASLAGYPEGASPQLTLLPGGMTGRTFKLAAEGQPSYVVRVFPADGTEDGLAALHTLLAEASVSPGVKAVSPTMMVMEFLEGKAPTVTQFLSEAVAGLPAIAVAADAVARLHTVDLEAAGVPPPRDELGFWFGMVEAMYGAQEDLLAQLRKEIAYIEALPAPAGPAGRLCLAHGDLHPGNMILSADGIRLVDFEHTRPRHAAHDIAYLFALLGDLRYTVGWTPSAEEPSPYTPLATRRAFAATYLQVVTGTADVPAADVDVFLGEVERAGYRQRFRLLLVWLLLTGGDTSHMLFGAVLGTLGVFEYARALLEGGDAGEILEKGLMATAAAKSAAAAAAAAST